MKIPSTRSHTLQFLLAGLAATLLAACEPNPASPRGFRLPDGDIEKGKTAFVQLECHLCHRVKGVELPPAPPGPRIDVPLGGEIYKVKTYGELVTSIIHPKHFVADRWEFMKDAEGKSVMPDQNNRMTVAQMIDLVAFLHSRYELLLPDYSGFSGP